MATPAALVRRWGGRAVALAVTGVGLYVVAPGLLSLFGSWPRLAEVQLRWFVLLVLLQTASFASLWWLTRLALEPHPGDADDAGRGPAGGLGHRGERAAGGQRGQQGGARRCGDRRGGPGQAADPGGPAGRGRGVRPRRGRPDHHRGAAAPAGADHPGVADRPPARGGAAAGAAGVVGRGGRHRRGRGDRPDLAAGADHDRSSGRARAPSGTAVGHGRLDGRPC